MATVEFGAPETSSSSVPAIGRPEPELKKTWEQVALVLFIAVPFAAVAAAAPVAWEWGLSWRDVLIAVGMYAITGHGVTVGFHRHFTHHAFKASTGFRAVLAVCGMMAIQGPVIRWVADHRRHHRFTDREGDPHSPWRYGRSLKALTKGFAYSHLLWLFEMEQTCEERFAPDLCRDPLIRPLVPSLPPLGGGFDAPATVRRRTVVLVLARRAHSVLLGQPRAGRRYASRHLAVNSVCHISGRAPFQTKDQSRNVWWLAIPSMGESWHNFHHAEPSAARHGVGAVELDTTAVIIRGLEHLHWVHDVRWPDQTIVARRRRVGSTRATVA